MWRVKTVTKFKNSFPPVLIYWNANRIHLGIIEKLNFPIWFPPLLQSRSGRRYKFKKDILAVEGGTEKCSTLVQMKIS